MRDRGVIGATGSVSGVVCRLPRPLTIALAVGALGLLAGCATAPPTRVSSLGRRVYDPKLGVWSSPQLVADGDAVPRGGGTYLTGRPYVIGGRTYVPSQNAAGYSVVGTASWYGDAFHGRRTANGEVFDKGSISAAHPTLPLPSYVRVTNMKNGRSMVVRVNDRGPYHGGRVMDVSQRVAEALAFKGEGTARIRVDYIGRAALAGSDDTQLLASLRTDGTPAQLDGMPSAPPTMVADADGAASEPPPPSRPSPPEPQPVARAAESEGRPDDERGPPLLPTAFVPTPPVRPFDLEPAGSTGGTTDRKRLRGHVAEAPAFDAPSLGPMPSPLLRPKAWRRQEFLSPPRSGSD